MCCWMVAEDGASACDADEEFECGNGTCVRLDRVCDGVNDCGQSEDEPAGLCGRNECQADNGGCDHICVDLKVGFKCQCRPGYALSGNSSCKGQPTPSIVLFVVSLDLLRPSHVGSLDFHEMKWSHLDRWRLFIHPLRIGETSAGCWQCCLVDFASRSRP